MYIPPKKWEWNKENGGKFSKINRPISGSTFHRDLPIGKHKLQLYSQGTPNGVKITILLEELLELNIQEADYDAWLIEISKGDQFSSGFVKANPNSKIPTLVDYTNNKPIYVFVSRKIYSQQQNARVQRRERRMPSVHPGLPGVTGRPRS